MGLIIYRLMAKGYKFIFSGDFNSYITLSQKDDVLCVFEFLMFLSRPGNSEDISEEFVKQLFK
jgi:hypothetical protein